MTNQQRRKVIRGLNGETETERQEIKQRQFDVRASWDTKTEFRRRVVKNDLGVVAQNISLADLLRRC
ncbi:hypothetical protein N9087_01450 [bacterium]|nr:hypothetical protein [bacterium]